jgi:hypothetical protein
MIHTTRRFRVAHVADAAELAKKLTQSSWVLCTGFRLGRLLFVNDSFSVSSASEYTVFDETVGTQIESITFGCCDEHTARTLIEALVEGRLRSPFSSPPPRLDHLPGSCHLCA